jgi:hypothetical protein
VGESAGYDAAVKVLRDNAREGDTWSGLPKHMLDESDVCRRAADLLVTSKRRAFPDNT